MQSKNANLNPELKFDRPEDVATSSDLTRSEKLELLRQWEQNATELQEAATEGMAGGEAALLQAVRQAISDVEKAKG